MANNTKKKAKIYARDCVACGCCVKMCPRRAICIHHGIAAKINEDKCIGCGICVKECPASVIIME